MIQLEPKEKMKDNEFCDNDYPAGKIGKNGCLFGNHSNIMQQAVCRNAAERAGASSPEDKFIIDSTWYMKRPKGCFAMDCSENPHGVCYFFNGSPLLPNNISAGTPICKRPKIANGTAIPNDAGNGCPSGYKPIMDEDTCRLAGGCMGMSIGSQFREGLLDKSLHNLYPIGCFIHPTEHKVYYNFPEEGYTAPTHPSGVPICTVSTSTKW